MGGVGDTGAEARFKLMPAVQINPCNARVACPEIWVASASL